MRVTCVETLATHILAPSFVKLQTRHPGIVIELIPDARELSLSMREADVAVRLKRPEQRDLITRRIGAIAFGLYASPDYLQCHGELDFPGGCPGHQLITQLEDAEHATQAGWLTELAPRARVAMRTCSHEAAVSAALYGGGLACLAHFRAGRERGLICLAAPSDIPPVDIWLMVHKDNRQTPRIRVVLTGITERIRKLGRNLLAADTHDAGTSTANHNHLQAATCIARDGSSA